MRRMIVLLIMLLSVSPVLSYAGGGGGGEEVIPEIVFRTNASQTVALLVRQGKLDASWADVKPEKAEKRMRDKYNGDWKVAFHNPQEKDTEKQTLYVILNLEGETIRANFSGM
ncbi:MAG: hypothetical protein KQH63_15295 [Desulfobulbaceae bacterium]|nr:hypothetical protein [Desulfobulbaceae bacterium]